ncbi:MAG: hypothetical protein ACE5EM_05320 [Sphingomonadales bacterium]
MAIEPDQDNSAAPAHRLAIVSEYFGEYFLRLFRIARWPLVALFGLAVAEGQVEAFRDRAAYPTPSNAQTDTSPASDPDNGQPACIEVKNSPTRSAGGAPPGTTTGLVLQPVPEYRAPARKCLILQTYNGSPMLLQISNRSAINALTFQARCGSYWVMKSLPPNRPTEVFRETREWSGCRLRVSNDTDVETPAVLSLMLVGQ